MVYMPGFAYDLCRRIILYSIKKASNIKISGKELEHCFPRNFLLTATQLIESLSLQISVRKKGLLYCGLCGTGPYTPSGFYLHLKRKHFEEITDLCEKELKRLFEAEKKLGYNTKL